MRWYVLLIVLTTFNRYVLSMSHLYRRLGKWNQRGFCTFIWRKGRGSFHIQTQRRLSVTTEQCHGQLCLTLPSFLCNYHVGRKRFFAIICSSQAYFLALKKRSAIYESFCLEQFRDASSSQLKQGDKSGHHSESTGSRRHTHTTIAANWISATYSH